MAMAVDHANHSAGIPIPQHRHTEPFSPTYDTSFSSPETQIHGTPMGVAPMSHQQQQHQHTSDAEHIWRGFEMTSNEQLPVWLSDQTLGGNTFSQNGMDAFLLPNDYLPPAPQIW